MLVEIHINYHGEGLYEIHRLAHNIMDINLNIIWLAECVAFFAFGLTGWYNFLSSNNSKKITKILVLVGSFGLFCFLYEHEIVLWILTFLSVIGSIYQLYAIIKTKRNKEKLKASEKCSLIFLIIYIVLQVLYIMIEASNTHGVFEY